MKKKFDNYIVIILSLIFLLNYIPLFSRNFFTKESLGVPLPQLIMVMGVEMVIMLLFFFIRKVDFNKEIFYNLAILLLFSFVQVVVQIISYSSTKNFFMEISNIVCKFCNVLFFYVLVLNLKIDQKYVNLFYHIVVLIGLITCFQNLWLYKDNIFIFLSGKIENPNTWDISSKSCFANRNQYAIFLFFCISAILFLKNENRSKIRNLYLNMSLLSFCFSLITTFSRTGIALCGMLIILYALVVNDMKWYKKIFIVLLIAIFLITFIKYYDLQEIIIDEIFRFESISTLTGRTRLWERAFKAIGEQKEKLVFGIGRFEAEELLVDKGLTQFHNTYIEFLVSGGIVEVCFFIGIYINILRKIFISNLGIKNKKTWFISYFILFVYMILESVGRFSIGCTDTATLILFVTMPILTTNIKEDKSEGKKCIENI